MTYVMQKYKAKMKTIPAKQEELSNWSAVIKNWVETHSQL